MKRRNHLWEKITSRENIEAAIRKAAKRKKRTDAVAHALENIEETTEKIVALLQAGTFKPQGYAIKLIFEPKLRIIYAAPFYPDRIVHHALMRVLAPIYESLFSDASYSCREGRGQHKASRKCMEYARKYKYCLQCDCSQFYVNIDHDIMKRLYRWKIKDKRVLDTLDSILSTVSTRQKNIEVLEAIRFRGVHVDQANTQLQKLMQANDRFAGAKAGEPIGNLLSQWDGNLYLTEFDHWVRNCLHCKPYIRFCDDFLLFSDDKTQLNEWAKMIREFLLTTRKIMLSKTAIFPTTQGVDFCGYRHFHDGKLLLRKRTAKNAKRIVQKTIRDLQKGRVSADSARSVLGSVRGALKHAKTYNFRRALGLDVIEGEVKCRAQAVC